MKKLLLLAPLAALVVGCGGAPTDTPSAPAETITVTETVTPEPEVRTETVTEEVQVTPQSCLDALNHAREISLVVVDFVELVQTYPPLIAKAYEAGYMGNNAQANEILATMENANVEQEDLNIRLEAVTEQFINARAKCEGKAS